MVTGRLPGLLKIPAPCRFAARAKVKSSFVDPSGSGKKGPTLIKLREWAWSPWIKGREKSSFDGLEVGRNKGETSGFLRYTKIGMVVPEFRTLSRILECPG